MNLTSIYKITLGQGQDLDPVWMFVHVLHIVFEQSLAKYVDSWGSQPQSIEKVVTRSYTDDQETPTEKFLHVSYCFLYNVIFPTQ